ncbi:unnamed protein product [Phaeothamnion confervicola]
MGEMEKAERRVRGAIDKERQRVAAATAAFHCKEAEAAGLAKALAGRDAECDQLERSLAEVTEQLETRASTVSHLWEKIGNLRRGSVRQEEALRAQLEDAADEKRELERVVAAQQQQIDRLRRRAALREEEIMQAVLLKLKGPAPAGMESAGTEPAVAAGTAAPAGGPDADDIGCDGQPDEKDDIEFENAELAGVCERQAAEIAALTRLLDELERLERGPPPPLTLRPGNAEASSEWDRATVISGGGASSSGIVIGSHSQSTRTLRASVDAGMMATATGARNHESIGGISGAAAVTAGGKSGAKGRLQRGYGGHDDAASGGPATASAMDPRALMELVSWYQSRDSERKEILKDFHEGALLGSTRSTDLDEAPSSSPPSPPSPWPHATKFSGGGGGGGGGSSPRSLDVLAGAAVVRKSSGSFVPPPSRTAAPSLARLNGGPSTTGPPPTAGGTSTLRRVTASHRISSGSSDGNQSFGSMTTPPVKRGRLGSIGGTSSTRGSPTANATTVRPMWH